jgi:hypothetical protein
MTRQSLQFINVCVIHINQDGSGEKNIGCKKKVDKQIANPQILGLVTLKQILKFPRYASSQIANPQIYLINPQISKYIQILHNCALKQS